VFNFRGGKYMSEDKAKDNSSHESAWTKTKKFGERTWDKTKEEAEHLKDAVFEKKEHQCSNDNKHKHFH
jgi:hypothetical protein